MENLELFSHHWFLSRNQIMLSFNGALSQEILVNLAEMIKQKIFSDKPTESFAKRVFAIFVELAQNIQRYSAEKESFDGKVIGSGSIIAFDADNRYVITSCNKIENQYVEEIKEHCRHINTLSKDELKNFYKETLRKSEEEGKITGGVGLIDIARKTSNKIGFHTIEIDGSYSYLIIIVKIDKEEGR